MHSEFQKAFSGAGYSCDNKFTPHLTLLKKGFKGRDIQNVPPEAYSELKDMFFGVQEFCGLQFLSMTKPQTKDGYYFSESEYLFKKRKAVDDAILQLQQRREKIRRTTQDAVSKAIISKSNTSAGNIGYFVAGLLTGAAIMWGVNKKLTK